MSYLDEKPELKTAVSQINADIAAGLYTDVHLMYSSLLNRQAAAVLDLLLDRILDIEDRLNNLEELA